MRTLLAFLAIGALATTLGCNGPSKRSGSQHATNQGSTGRHTGENTPADEGTGTRTGTGTGTTGHTGTGAGTTATTGTEKGMVMLEADQTITVEQGKKAQKDLKLQEKATAAPAGTVKATVQNNKGLNVQVGPVAANKDAVKVTVDATNAQPGTYTVDVSEGTSKAGSFQVTVTKKK